MNPVAAGYRIVMAVVLGVGISTAAASGLTLYLTGTLNLVALVITLGLCYLLYTGRNWARWPAGVLWILSGSILIFASLALSFGASLMGLIYRISLFGTGLILFSSGAALMFSKHLRTHFIKVGEND